MTQIQNVINVRLIRLLTAKNVRDVRGEFMAVQEYNNNFLPRIERAKEFISLFESSIQHMDDKKVDKDEVKSSSKFAVGQTRQRRPYWMHFIIIKNMRGLKIRSSMER